MFYGKSDTTVCTLPLGVNPCRLRRTMSRRFIFSEEILKGFLEELVQAHTLPGSEYLTRS